MFPTRSKTDMHTFDLEDVYGDICLSTQVAKTFNFDRLNYNYEDKFSPLSPSTGCTYRSFCFKRDCREGIELDMVGKGFNV